MRTIFERVAMGGDHIQCATLEDLAFVMADAAISITSTTEDTVFGTSLAMYRYETNDHSDLFMRNLLYVLTSDHFTPEKRAYRVSTDDLPVLAKNMGIKPEDLRTALGHLTSKKIGTHEEPVITGFANTHQQKPRVIIVEDMAATHDRVNGIYYIQPQVLIAGIDSTAVLDTTFYQATLKLIEGGANITQEEDQEAMAVAALLDEDDGIEHTMPPPSKPTFNFVTFVRAIRKILKDGKHSDTSALYILEGIKKHYTLGLFETSVNADSSRDWLLDLTAHELEELFVSRAKIPKFFQDNAFIAITPKYMDLIKQLTSQASRVARSVLPHIPLPGVYPLLMPRHDNIRLTETITVTDTQLPQDMVYIDSAFVRNKGGNPGTEEDDDEAWRALPFKFTADSRMDRGTFFLAHRLQKHFNFSSSNEDQPMLFEDLDQDDENIDLHRLDAILQFYNMDAFIESRNINSHNIPRPFDKYVISPTFTKEQISTAPDAPIRFLLNRMRAFRGQAILPTLPPMSQEEENPLPHSQQSPPQNNFPSPHHSSPLLPPARIRRRRFEDVDDEEDPIPSPLSSSSKRHSPTMRNLHSPALSHASQIRSPLQRMQVESPGSTPTRHTLETRSPARATASQSRPVRMSHSQSLSLHQAYQATLSASSPHHAAAAAAAATSMFFNSPTGRSPGQAPEGFL